MLNFLKKRKEGDESMENDKPNGDNFDPASVEVPEGYKVVKEDEVVSKDKFDTILQRLDSFDQRLGGMVTERVPVQTGPTLDDQLTELDRAVEKLDAQIDEAVTAGKPISEINRKRDALLRQRNDIVTDAKINRFANSGMGVIGELTDEVISGKMRYLQIPGVKRDYDNLMKTLDPGVRSSPKIRMEMYNLAVGRNHDIVVEADIEQRNRQKAQDDVDHGQEPKRRPGRQVQTESNTIPTFAEYFGRDAMDEIRAKGMTPDEWVRRFTGSKDMTAEEYVKLAIGEGGNA